MLILIINNKHCADDNICIRVNDCASLLIQEAYKQKYQIIGLLTPWSAMMS
jgi:TPP-dependent indolepyruvate ferredoxin oxidoreductase alpha subunit